MGSSDEQNRVEDKMEVVIGLWACGLLGSYLLVKVHMENYRRSNSKYRITRGVCILAFLGSFLGPVVLIAGVVGFCTDSDWAKKPWK